jgi:hypothetical protein
MRHSSGPAQGLAVDMVCAAPVGSTARSHTDAQAAAQHAQPTTLVSCAEAPADGEQYCTGLVLAVELIQVCSGAVACRVRPAQSGVYGQQMCRLRRCI